MQNGRYGVYVMADAGRERLITGLTSVIREHVWQQKEQTVGGGADEVADRLVLYEAFDDPAAAVARFDELQNHDRHALISTVGESNPNWRDLSDGWFERATCE